MKRGIDVGNYSLKEFINDKTFTIIKSLVAANENLLGSKLKLEYNNKTYFIGEGNFETEINKAGKENFLPLLLTGLALNSADPIQQVICGLPINQYKANKDALKEEILSNRMYNIKLNDKPKKIIIDKLEIYPEGAGAYYSLETKEDVIIIDIGGLTTNIAYVVNGDLKAYSTVIVGTLKIYKEIADRLNSLYTLNFDIQRAEKTIDKGYLNVDGEMADLSFTKEILKANFAQINEDLLLKFPARTEKLVLAGGGYKLFEKAFKNRYRNSYVADNPVFANSIGFRKVAGMLWN